MGVVMTATSRDATADLARLLARDGLGLRPPGRVPEVTG